MEDRINDLCEALFQFYLGIVPMAAAIYDDLESLMTSGTSTFSVPDCRRMLKILGDAKELDIQLGIKLHEIRFLVGKLQPFESAVLNSGERKVKTLPTAEDALKSLQGLSAEDVAKLLEGLK